MFARRLLDRVNGLLLFSICHYKMYNAWSVTSAHNLNPLKRDD